MKKRINRKKHFSGFPKNSIEECLRIAEIEEGEITDVAFNTKPMSNLIPKGIFLKNLFHNKSNAMRSIKKKN